MSLPAIELELLRTLPSLNLRPTLEAARTAGKLLEQARDLVPHGGWLQFLARIGLTQRTAHDYVTVYRHAGDQRTAATMTIKQFLVQIRDAQRRERLAERSRVRAEVAAKNGKLDEDVVRVNQDCKKFRWPKQVDSVVTDPSWADLDLYQWLGRFCVGHLRPGGLLLCQVGTSRMPAVMNIFSDAGLTYRWVLAVVYDQTRFCRPFGVWSPGWRPVLVYSNCKADKTPLTSDTYTLPAANGRAALHDWQQPQEPISHWVGRLTRPGDVVADPFAGSGTTAVACRTHGRKFVGTEIDEEACRIARGRLSGPDIRAWAKATRNEGH